MLWRGAGAAFVQVPRLFTPQDRLDRLPGAFAGGTSRLVFDGRLDNRDDLLVSLAVNPEKAARLGDGALLMMALERWGADACSRLVGAFSFAWWDEAAGRLLLAVDATGGRALFVHTGGGRICFATRPMAVLAFPGVERKVDRQAMAHLLLARPLPADATPFEGVFRLPSGSCLIWKDGRHRVERYWRPDPGRRIHYRDSRDYVAAAREMLDRVVGAQLRSAGPIACQLSGGLDSPAVAATLARLCAPSPLHTLTSFPDPDVRLPKETPKVFYNEAPLAAATADLYPNIVPHYIATGPLTAGEEDPARLFWEFGLPVRNFMNLGGWEPLYARARALGAAVVFTGHSGNYTLSWKSEALLADLAASGRLIELARQFRGLKRNGQRLRPQLRDNLLGYLAPASLRDLWRRRKGREGGWRLRSVATEELAACVRADEIVDRVRIATNLPDRDRRRRIAYLERSWAAGQWMAASPYVNGCDLRDPLGDRRMVEFCLALPAEIWQAGGEPRSFARRVLRDRLPAQVVEEKARGYQNGDWYHRLTLLRPVLMAELERLEGSPAARDMLDLTRIRAVAENWPADADAAMARASDMLDIVGRGIHYGRFIRWVEGSNG